MRPGRTRAAIAALLVSALSPVSAARAKYVFDPADLPPRFACETDWSPSRCDEERRHEAWWTKYDKRFDHWFNALLFDTATYFSNAVPAEPASPPGDLWEAAEVLDQDSGNLVDAIYEVALRRYSGGWAFAVRLDCPEPVDKAPERCVPKLRMVSFKPADRIDKARAEAFGKILPTTMAELARGLSLTADWREADLRRCKGALAELAAFPAQKGRRFWHPRYMRWLQGEAPAESDEIIITADGSGVSLRAVSMGDPEGELMPVGGGTIRYGEWNGGEGYIWARRMAEVVEPCLKPATAPAPWEKMLDRAAAGSPAK